MFSFSVKVIVVDRILDEDIGKKHQQPWRKHKEV